MSLSLVKTACDARYVHISPITIARAFISPWIKTHPIRGQYNLSAKLSRLSNSVVCINDTNVALREYHRPVVESSNNHGFVIGPTVSLPQPNTPQVHRFIDLVLDLFSVSFLFVPFTYVEPGIGR